MVIDRFEGRYAVCELPSGTTVDVLRELLPEDAREGDVVVAWADGRLTIDVRATESRKSRVQSLHDRLFGGTPV